ncbi:MAG: hypothetical protein ACRD1Z_21310, partial [Vicinamibacteria bacterium]
MLNRRLTRDTSAPQTRDPLRFRDPVSRIPGVGPGGASRLAQAGFATVGDFLLALPFRYEDRRRFSAVSALE